jgi:hypothetical protein
LESILEVYNNMKRKNCNQRWDPNLRGHIASRALNQLLYFVGIASDICGSDAESTHLNSPRHVAVQSDYR